ncbi:MAG: hypothetical protein EXS46_02655 [Candidatus Taylorbacteria bacterium]|nr:hypothetical protein [Candidatus Taylorbacteria bacterium]
MRKLIKIFLVSFALNFIWENLHSILYITNRGGEITQLILARATLVDSIIITVLAIPFIYLKFFKKRNWLIIPICIVISVLIEAYAIDTGRWVYASSMPIIPILDIGLTPTLQLGILGYLTFAMII